MSVFGPIRRSSVVALAITVCLGTAGPLVRVHDAAGREQRLTCANFRSQSDTQAAFTADPSDPFGLDVDNNGVACQTEERFGTSPLVTCDDLRDYPDAQPALQGLYDYTQAVGDPYTLDADGNGIACDAGDGKGNRRHHHEELDGPPASGRRGREALDGPTPERRRDDRETLERSAPVSRRGPTVVVSTGARSTGETLEARLEARFAALEAQFAAFAGRAANGFGRFPDAGDEAMAGGQAITVAVATSRPSIALPHRTSGKDSSPIIRAQQATDGTGERGTARKGKRDRHKGERRKRH
jgi:hypothetical protein